MRALLPALFVVGCGGRSHRAADSGIGPVPDAGALDAADTVFDSGPPPPWDSGPPPPEDSGPPCPDEEERCDEGCVDSCDPDLPSCSDIGAQCRDNRDCELGFFCVPDANGWPDGYCIAGGPLGGGACDPALPASCPEGSSCLYGGRDEDGTEYYYCFKDCTISDRNPWNSSACGCRDGYECDFLLRACVPGCTDETVQDACCRYWDEDERAYRPVPDCEVVCDEDSARCTNAGDADATWGDPCEFDQDCPAEGTCLRERDADGDLDTAGLRWVGGYCTRLGCDLPGRDCADGCRAAWTGAWPDPWRSSAPMCVATCTVAAEGADPFAPNLDCREDYGCWADPSDPEAERNGYCWSPARESDVPDPATVGGPCLDVGGCYSPFDQGWCLSEDSGWIDGTCALEACDFPGMEGRCAAGRVCEPLGPGTLCLDACDAPGVGVGVAVGCRDDFYACYAAAAAGGVCLPSCAVQDDPAEFCGTFFDGAPDCDLDTGICS